MKKLIKKDKIIIIISLVIIFNAIIAIYINSNYFNNYKDKQITNIKETSQSEIKNIDSLSPLASNPKCH